jgi:hypothetical protein
MKRKAANVEYPALKGKVVRQLRFANDEDFTVLVIEFEDNTHVSFRLKATIELSMEPKISTLRSGNIVNWKKLKAQPIKRRGEGR